MLQLPDISVWLALAFNSRPDHLKAVAWFAGMEDRSCHFCRMTQQGFLRLATTKAMMGQDLCTMTEAWHRYDKLHEDPRVGFVEEPKSDEPLWRSFTLSNLSSPKLWNVAYLAAFAMQAGLEIVSFDSGFRQFPELACTILT